MRTCFRTLVFFVVAAVVFTSAPSRCSGAAVERRWIEDPIVVPVDFWAKAYAGSTFTVSLAGAETQGPATDCAIDTIAPMRTAYLKTFRKYTLTISGPALASVEWIELIPRVSVDLISPNDPNLKTFKLYINGAQADRVDALNPSGLCDALTQSWDVEIRPDQGPRPIKSQAELTWSRAEENLGPDSAPGDAAWPELGPGLSDQPAVAGLKWAVNVGRLNSGRAAGQIRLREAGLSASSFAPAALLYSPPTTDSNQLEVLVVSGALRQISAPQTFIDIVTLDSYAYEIRFYLPSEKGSKTSSGLYPDPGGSGFSPFVTWKIESPNRSLAQLRITELRNQTSYASELTYDSTSQLWTLTTGTSTQAARIFKRLISIDSPTQRTETVEITNPAGELAYRAVELYQRLAWGWELKEVTKNPGTQEVKTSYSFYEDPAVATHYAKLKSITHSDGNWEKREYYTQAEDDPWSGRYAGALARVLRPWKDSIEGTTAITPDNATPFNSQCSDYIYSPPDQPFSVRWVLQRYRKDYPEENDTRAWLKGDGFIEASISSWDGDLIREESTWHAFSGGRGYLELSKSYPTSRGDLAEQPYAEQHLDGLFKSFYYERGTYNPSDLTFTVQAGGPDWRITSISGGDPATYAPGTGPGIATSWFDHHPIDPIYVVPNQSTKETRILQKGNLMLRQLYVVSGYDSTTGQFSSELIDQQIHAYDALGHLISRTRKDPVSGVTRILYTADWRSPVTGKPHGLKQSETDETGIRTEYTYDSHKRPATITQTGIGDIASIVVSCTYDAADNKRTEIISASGLTLSRAWEYDLAGRLRTERAQDGLVTQYQYSAGGRVITITYPGGASETIEYFKDGRIKSRTGNAIVPEFYDYGQSGIGASPGSPEAVVVDRATTTIRLGSSSSSRWHRQVFDLGAKLIGEHQPGLHGVLQKKHVYDGRWRYQHLAEPAQDELVPSSDTARITFTLFESAGNILGNPLATGTAVGSEYVPDPNANTENRRQRHDLTYQKIGADWYLTQTTTAYLVDASDQPTVLHVTRQRLTGLAADVESQVTYIDVDNQTSTLTVTVDPAARKRTHTVQTPQSANPAVRITVNGLIESESTPTVTTPTRYFYDPLGRVIRIQDPLGYSTRAEYDPSTGRLTATYNKADQKTRYDYYPATHLNAGRIWYETANNEKRTYFEYNARGQLIRSWGDVPYPQELVYDDFGQLTELRTYRSGTWTASSWPGDTLSADSTRWNYDPGSGWLLSKEDPLGRSVSYGYYTNGLVKSRTWHRGISALYTYSGYWDLEKVDYTDDTSDLVYGNFNRAGQPRSITDATGTRTLSYDAAGRLETDRADSGLFAGITLRQHYNPPYGRDYVRIEGLSTVLEHSYGFNALDGRLETAAAGPVSVTYSYKPGSDLVETVGHRHNGTLRLTTTRLWELGHRLDAISHSAGGRIVSAFDYHYDSVNRRQRVTLADGSYWQYGYNDRNEVISGKRYWPDASLVAGQQFDYAYDPIGNRDYTYVGGDSAGSNRSYSDYIANSLNQYASRDVPGRIDVIGLATSGQSVLVNTQAAYRRGDYFHGSVAVANGTAPVDAALNVSVSGGSTVSGNVLVARTPETYGYDTEGNLTGSSVWTCGWDAENRLTWIQSTSAVPESARKRLEFAYDHLGRRVFKKVYRWNGTAYELERQLKWLYDGWFPLAELDGNNNLVRTYLWGLDLSGTMDGLGGAGGLVALRRHGTGASDQFAISDGNGNVTALISATDGLPVGRYEYGPFGELLRATGSLARDNPILWSSKYLDLETGLVYYGYRYYEPATGRWLNRDPIGEAGGLNPYAFAANDPVNRVDLWGLLSEEEELDIRLAIAAEHSGFIATYAYGQQERALHDKQWAEAKDDFAELGKAAIGLAASVAGNAIATRITGAILARAAGSAAALGSKLAKLSKRSPEDAPNIAPPSTPPSTAPAPATTRGSSNFGNDAAKETHVLLKEGQKINRVWDSRWTPGSSYSGPFGGSYSPNGALPINAPTAIETRGLNIPGVLNNAERGGVYNVTRDIPATLRTSIGGTEPELTIAPQYRQYLKLLDQSVSTLPRGR